MAKSGKANLLIGFILGLAASVLGLLTTRSYFQHPVLEAAPQPAATRQFSSTSWIWIVTAGAAALLIGLGMLRLLELLIRPLEILVLGITLATSLSPLVKHLERRIPRMFSVVLIYLVFIFVWVGVGWIIIPPLVGQAQEVVDQIPNLIDLAQQRLNRWIW